MKTSAALLALGLATLTLCPTLNGQERITGPLYAPSVFIPYALFYHNPGLPASTVQRGELVAAQCLYVSNDICVVINSITGKAFTVQDYETLSLEENFSYGVADRVELGCTIRLLGYWGGFFDYVIEEFHAVTHAPNGGRECFPQNRMVIHLENDSGVTLEESGDRFSLGDTDFWIK